VAVAAGRVAGVASVAVAAAHGVAAVAVALAEEAHQDHGNY